MVAVVPVANVVHVVTGAPAVVNGVPLQTLKPEMQGVVVV
jgi:hypothetical protein